MDIASVPVPVEIGHAEGTHCAIVSDDDGTSGGESVTLALLDLSAECKTLAGEYRSIRILSGSAARDPIGSLPLSAECVTLARVATRCSSGISKVIIT